MKKILQTSILLSLPVLLFLTGCAKQEQNQVKGEAKLETLNIGYQKAALKLIVAKQNQLFEQAFPSVNVQWKEFPAGPQTLEALAVGSIDFGYTGDAPVVFALSAGKSLKYLGYEQSSQQAHAILLPTGSTLTQLSDLKGKRIAVTRGSSAHNFLAETLKKAQLSWDDIQPIWLSPSDARVALDKKAIDAWAVWDPYISAAEIDGNATILSDSRDLPKTYAFYLAQPKFVEQYPADAQKALEVLNSTDQWINTHFDESAEILAKSTGLDLSIAKKVLSKKYTPNPVQTLDDQVIQAQQAIAKVFFEQKLIPSDIDAAQFVWSQSKYNLGICGDIDYG